MTKFLISERKNGEFQFTLLGENGLTLLKSEGYTTKSNCTNGSDSVKRNGVNMSRFDLKESVNGMYYFNLKATNGQVIGTSKMYDSETGRLSDIETIQTAIPNAVIQYATEKQLWPVLN